MRGGLPASTKKDDASKPNCAPISAVTNNSTTVGKNLLFGVDPGRPTLVHAANIGPGSEFVTINHIDSWVVTNDNKEIFICNPNATSISYSLYLLGTAYD